MTGGVHEHMRAWDPEEDNIIITLLNQLGPKWSRIVQQLPGRSVSSVRNRWQRIEKGRKLREAGQESKNRCQRCGQPKRGHVCTAKLRVSGTSAVAYTGRWEAADMRGSPLLSRQDSDGGLFRPPSALIASEGGSASFDGSEGGSPPHDEPEAAAATTADAAEAVPDEKAQLKDRKSVV